MMFMEAEKNSLNLVTEDDLEEDSMVEQATEATFEKQSNNPDWDSRLELLRVCSSNGKFVTKKARAPPIGGKWATDEDEHLRDIVRVHGAENWRKVAMLLGPTRTDVQCLHRWNKVLRPGLQKGAWSANEDKLVREAVQFQAHNGMGRILWSEIATQLPGRLGKQCRERYFNHLDPSINKGDWTPPEDRILYEGQRQFGNRWCEISKVLPGRTENSVKNRWNSSAMRRWLKENFLTPGDGTPLHSIDAIEDLQRALASFSDALAACGISISRETAATLLSDMSSITVDNVKAGGKEKSKKDKPKKKGNAIMPDNGAEFIFDEFTDGISRNSSWEGIDHVKESNGMMIRGSDDNVKDQFYQNNRSFSNNSNSSSSSNLCGNGNGNGNGNGMKSRNGSAIGMSLPSHLRPPLIVTVGGNGNAGGGQSSGSLCTATGTSEDHLLLVELLSNMKSSPKWGQQDTFVPVAPHVHIAPSPYDRKRLQQVQSGNGNYNVHFNGHGHESKVNDYGSVYGHNRVSSKRLKVEGQIESSTPWKRPSDEVATPTDRALKRVRAELKRRDRQKEEGMAQGQGQGQGQGRILGTMSGSGNGDGHLSGQAGAPDRQEQGHGQADGRDIVPFQLLPFFEFLDDHAQRCLMRQLVDHFQQTSYTPRNFNALLPTPRPLSGSCRSPDHLQHFVSVNGSYAYGYDANTDTLTLCSPRGDNKSTVNSRALYSFDPKCFEEDHPSTQVTAKAEFRGTISNERENNEDVWEYSECLDAPVNAAVNVALKCATREASFEEVLSWLGRAPDHFVNSSVKIDHPSATSSPIIDEVTLQDASFSSTSTHTTRSSDVGSNSGMSLPSHLRPPLIVTAGIPEKGIGSLGSTPVPTPTPGTSDDHLFLVELLSNMKSSPKWGQQDTFVPVAPHVHIAPSPYDRKRLQQVQPGNGNYNVHFNGHGNEYGNGGGNGNLKSEDVGIAHNKDTGKRLKVEGQVESSTSWKRPNEEAATPTDRALKRVRAELTRRDGQKEEGMAQGRGLGTMSSDGHLNSQAGASDRQEQGQAQRRDVVPFQLLPFFEYLDDHAQRCLMRQLVDHFQQTSYTPRNFNALLPTPRFAYSSSNFHAGGGCLDDIDPNCFEEGAVTFTSFSSNTGQQQRVAGEINLQSSDHIYGGSRQPTGGEILARGVDRYRESGGWDKDDSNSTSSSCDAVQAYLDAPVNAAVNVALKCATREASFEEVLSWLASSNQSGFEYVPPAYGDSYANTHTHASQGSFHGHMSSLSSAYHLM